MLIDVLILVVIAVVAWCVASEGAWGAGLILLSVLFAGLLAMNFFEPLANLLSDSIPGLASYWDLVSLVGLFALFTFLFRLGADQLSATQIEIDGYAYQGARWGFAVLSGYITAAFLLAALHTAPLPREFIGFKPERKNLFNVAAPDRQWLGFTQYVTERVFAKGRIFDGLVYAYPGTKKGKEKDKQQVWSSFPIRYATRREQITKGSVKAAPTLVVPGSAPAGGGTAAPAGGGF